jgi:hypothetical protein
MTHDAGVAPHDLQRVAGLLYARHVLVQKEAAAPGISAAASCPGSKAPIIVEIIGLLLLRLC